MGTLATLVVKLVGDVSGFRSSMGEAGSVVRDAGRNMSSAGQDMTLKVTAPLALLGGLALNTAMDYESSMNMMAATSGATVAQMAQIGDMAQSLGADMTLPGTSAADAAQAMTELVKAGLSVEDAMTAARGVLQMSAAGDLENAEAATIAANALNSFGLAGTEATRVADLLAAGANNSSASVRSLSQGLQMSSAVAASAGVPIEDLTTMLSQMSNAGIQGSDAGTSIKTMLLSLMAPTDKAAGVIKSLGIQIYDAHGKMLPMENIINQFSSALHGVSTVTQTVGGRTAEQNKQLKAAQSAYDAATKAIYLHQTGIKVLTDKTLSPQIAKQAAANAEIQRLKSITGETVTSTRAMTDAQRNAALATIFGTDAIRAANVVMMEGAGAFKEMKATVTEVGAAQELSAAKMKGLRGALEGLKSTVETVMLTIGVPFLNTLEGWVRPLADNVAKLGEVDPKLIAMAVSVGVVVAAIGPLLMILGPVVSGFGVLITVLGVIASPIGLVIGAIVLFGVAVVKHFGGIRPTIEAARNAIAGALATIKALFSGEGGPIVWAQAFDRAKEIVSQAVALIQNIVYAVIGQVKIFIRSHGEEIADFFRSAWTQIGTIINLALQVIQVTIIPILKGIQIWIRSHTEEIQAVLGGAWGMIKNLIQGALTLIQGVLRAALAILRGDWSGAWQIIQDTVASVWVNIQGYIVGALTILQTIFGPAFEIIKTAISTKWAEITAWFAGLPATMTQLGSDLIQGVIDGIKSIDILQFIEDLFGDIIAIAKRILKIPSSPSGVFMEIGGDVGSGFANGIRASTPAAVDAVNAMMSQVGRARPAQFALATATTGGYGAAGQRAGGRAGGGDTFNISMTMNVQGGGDARAVGRAAEDGMLRALRQVGRR